MERQRSASTGGVFRASNEIPVGFKGPAWSSVFPCKCQELNPFSVTYYVGVVPKLTLFQSFSCPPVPLSHYYFFKKKNPSILKLDWDRGRTTQKNPVKTVDFYT